MKTRISVSVLALALSLFIALPASAAKDPDKMSGSELTAWCTRVADDGSQPNFNEDACEDVRTAIDEAKTKAIAAAAPAAAKAAEAAMERAAAKAKADKKALAKEFAAAKETILEKAEELGVACDAKSAEDIETCLFNLILERIKLKKLVLDDTQMRIDFYGITDVKDAMPNMKFIRTYLKYASHSVAVKPAKKVKAPKPAPVASDDSDNADDYTAQPSRVAGAPRTNCVQAIFGRFECDGERVIPSGDFPRECNGHILTTAAAYCRELAN